MKRTVFCAALLLAAGCSSPKKNRTVDPLRVETIVAAPSADVGAAVYVGAIEEESSAALSFPVAGTVARTFADEGRRVGKGHLLAELDPTSARRTFEAAEAALNQAKDACARLKQLYDAESLPVETIGASTPGVKPCNKTSAAESKISGRMEPSLSAWVSSMSTRWSGRSPAVSS